MTDARWVFAVLFRVVSKMARPERFELPTPRFVVWIKLLKSFKCVTEMTKLTWRELARFGAGALPIRLRHT